VVARFLDAPLEPMRVAFRAAHGGSVGRWERDLSAEDLAEVEEEAGELLSQLGYV
jgi:hypothetical protein